MPDPTLCPNCGEPLTNAIGVGRPAPDACGVCAACLAIVTYTKAGARTPTPAEALRHFRLPAVQTGLVAIHAARDLDRRALDAYPGTNDAAGQS